MLAYQCGQNIYYRSFRDVAVGEELLVWYSDSYQKHLEIPMTLKETDRARVEGMLYFLKAWGRGCTCGRGGGGVGVTPPS